MYSMVPHVCPPHNPINSNGLSSFPPLTQQILGYRDLPSFEINPCPPLLRINSHSSSLISSLQLEQVSHMCYIYICVCVFFGSFIEGLITIITIIIIIITIIITIIIYIYYY